MSDLHLDDFYRDTARIVVSLLRVFPRPVAIYAEDICGPDETDEYGMHSPRHQACFATLLWLGEEGYLRYDDTIRMEAIDQAVLTGRCFNALIRPNTDLQDPSLPELIRRQRASLGHALGTALKNKDQLALLEHVQTLIGLMAGFAPPPAEPSPDT